MRMASTAKLLGAVSAIAIAVALCGVTGVVARNSSSSGVCSTQTEIQAELRIAACSALIAGGRLNGEAAGFAHAVRGLAYLDNGDIPHAIADLDRAIKLAPNFAPAYENRGNAWYARGNHAQALADYDAAIRIDPHLPSPYI